MTEERIANANQTPPEELDWTQAIYGRRALLCSTWVNRYTSGGINSPVQNQKEVYDSVGDLINKAGALR